MGVPAQATTVLQNMLNGNANAPQPSSNAAKAMNVTTSVGQPPVPSASKNEAVRDYLTKSALKQLRNGIYFAPPGEEPGSGLGCIAGVCNVYRHSGVDFGKSDETVPVPGAKENEGQNIYKYNPSFAKNAKKAGFNPIEIKDEEDFKNKVEPGDMIQYIDAKNVPHHMRLAMGKDENGNVKMYDNYDLGQGGTGLFTTNDNIPETDFKGHIARTIPKGERVVIYKPSQQVIDTIASKNPTLLSDYQKSLNEGKTASTQGTKSLGSRIFLTPGSKMGKLLLPGGDTKFFSALDFMKVQNDPEAKSDFLEKVASQKD